MNRLGKLSLAISLLLFAPVSSVAAANETDAEGTYIVVLRSAADFAGAENAVANKGGTTQKRFSYAINALSIKLKHSEVARLRNEPMVAFVELDQPVYTLDTQTPTPSWGLDRIDQKSLPLNSSFTFASKGLGVDAYIVDTGINATHTEFTGRLISGYSAISDGRGTGDCNGHGTHVAGTTAGTAYGVAKAATLIPVRVLDCAGSGTTTGVIAGLDWIVQHHVAGKPAVANMSLGGGASSALDTAVQNVINDGVVMAVAAGNSNTNACNSSPARAVNAITVGATTSTDARASYSNFGTCLDIFAPGSSITSAWINSTTATNTISGTSMATPHVAGVIAVLLGTSPTSTPSEIATMLRSSSTPNLVTAPGTGSPNYLLYLDPAGSTIVTPPPAPAPTAPAAPTIGTASANRGKSATVNWTQGSNGGSAITSHVVTAYLSGSTTVSKTVIVSGSTATSATVTGLTAGRSYTFKVQARNAIGSSPLSASSNSITALK
jgi:subtilisin family serine protease